MSAAYARLTLDQLIAGKVGAGSFVQAPDRDHSGRAAHGPRPGPAAGAGLASARRVAQWSGMPVPLRHPLPEGRSRYEFIGGCATPGHFPMAAWRRCVAHALRQDPALRGRYADTQGLPALREAIARHISYARGVVCGAANILVTNGAQQGLDLSLIHI